MYLNGNMAQAIWHGERACKAAQGSWQPLQHARESACRSGGWCNMQDLINSTQPHAIWVAYQAPPSNKSGSQQSRKNCALTIAGLTGPARLPGFHTCVGGGGDKHDKSWYEEKGAALIPLSIQCSLGDGLASFIHPSNRKCRYKSLCPFERRKSRCPQKRKEQSSLWPQCVGLEWGPHCGGCE